MYECKKKQDPSIHCLEETHFRSKDRYRVRGWKKVSNANGNKKKVGVAILISGTTDFTETVTRDKGRCIMIKTSIQQKDITTVNVYAPKIGAPKYSKQVLTDTDEETDNNTIIIGDLNTPLTSMDRSSRQKIRQHWF